MKTGIAFNNFDRFVDTPTAKNTLHDTVGIIFQDIIDPSNEIEPSTSTTIVQDVIDPSNEIEPSPGSTIVDECSNSSNSNKRKRRTFEYIEN